MKAFISVSYTHLDVYKRQVLIIPKDMYAGLDGKGLLALCMETLKEKG